MVDVNNKILSYADLGFIDYKEAWDLQYKIHTSRVQGTIKDHFLLLEHPNTYTLGKTADKSNLIGNEEYLKEKNISVYDIDRGGDITYHGPGQIVGYPIINLNDWKQDTHKYLRALEEMIIRVCFEYGLIGRRDPRYTGVWIDDRKIAAIGIKVSRWVTMHGFAFNINTDLSLFDGIIPCGISGKAVTSLKKEIDKTVEIDFVKSLILKHFTEVFEYNSIELISKDELLAFELTLTN
ncbi:MAG TPA: lipoyl(octanoyl) transferase LipB [Ignavibacteriaceae bacterium]|nr:lipoyl(octanoyl) transferase LipB [Ignavibacteriaceae bacterium]